MKAEFARIRFANGARVMPAESPYDQQLVFEEAQMCARRYGAARIEVARGVLQVQRSPGTERPCIACARQPAVSFAIRNGRWCARCAQQAAAAAKLFGDCTAQALTADAGSFDSGAWRRPPSLRHHPPRHAANSRVR